MRLSKPRRPSSPRKRRPAFGRITGKGRVVIARYLNDRKGKTPEQFDAHIDRMCKSLSRRDLRAFLASIREEEERRRREERKEPSHAK